MRWSNVGQESGGYPLTIDANNQRTRRLAVSADTLDPESNVGSGDDSALALRCLRGEWRRHLGLSMDQDRCEGYGNDE
jgi:hypothetical protein